MNINWSSYQRNIFNAYQHENCNLSIQAGPGSGKTTVLKQLCRLTPQYLSCVFLAFNKSIVKELKSKLPSSVSVLTLHSLGIRSLFSEYGKVKVNESKTFWILKKLEKKWSKELSENDIINTNQYFSQISDLYDLYRVNLLEVTGKESEIVEIADKYGILCDNLMLKHFFKLVSTLKRLNTIKSKVLEIDFIDMIYLPVVQDLHFKKYDRIFLDESQDLNICQQYLVQKIKKKSTKMVTVGDPYQCIYAFLGADTESFKKLSNLSNTKKLPLPISYRCPGKVVEKVNTVFDVVEKAPDAIDGEIIEEGTVSMIEEGDMVLCRNNKPLLLLYFKLLKKHKKAYIRGAEFGKGIVKILERYKHYTVEYAIETLYSELDKLGDKLIERGVKSPLKHRSYLKLQENIELIKIISENYSMVSEIIPVAERIFLDDGDGVMLSTIHKAKGLEANNVFILNRELIPSKYATKEWEIEQEKRLLFVAYSRSIEKLIFISN